MTVGRRHSLAGSSVAEPFTSQRAPTGFGLPAPHGTRAENESGAASAATDAHSWQAEGSGRSFEERVAEHRPMLMRFARQRVRNETWAEDAVSETLLVALSKPAAFAGRATLRTWLVGILKNKLSDQIRHHSREMQSPLAGERSTNDEWDIALANEAVTYQDFDDPLEHLGRHQFMGQLGKALRALPPKQAQAFMLRNWMGEETSCVCERLGVTPNHLGVILHRARSGLRASLSPSWSRLHSSRQGAVRDDHVCTETVQSD